MRIQCRHQLHEAGQGRLGVRNKVLAGHAPYQAGDRLPRGFIRSGNAPALHAASVDVVPNAHREFQPAVVGHLDQAVERREVALLLLAA